MPYYCYSTIVTSFRKGNGLLDIDLEIENISRFNMMKPAERQKNYLRPVTWAVSFPSVWSHKTKIVRTNMEELKPPYILLCNHNAFLDFKVATAAIFPTRANYVVAIDGFIGREWLMRKVGCICKRKFTNDISLVRQLKRVTDNGDIAVIYPEARYSLCGTNSFLPESLGKLAKLLKVPVVTLICHGNHINSPFWNTTDHGVKGTEGFLTQIITAEEVASLPVTEINRRINEKFVYDDYAWQKENNIRVKYPNRAKGLHKILYQCPNCGTEYQMASAGTKLECKSCGKEWEMSELGELRALNGKTEFSHIPDWYEWEKDNVREEIENGSYYFKAPVKVCALPNSKGYIKLGKGTLTHDMNGFVLEGKYGGHAYRVEKSVPSLYSCHIEFNYLNKFGDCIDLNTLSDTYYIYPYDCDFSVTKVAMATEELFFADRRKKIEGKEKVQSI